MGKVKVKKPKEKAFVLRLPEGQAKALNELVDKGVAFSLNALIVNIIAGFLADMRAEANAKRQ